MDTGQHNDAGEELRKLREKTGMDELSALGRGVFGGYSRGKVDAYILRLKEQMHTAERTFKEHIAELAAEKEQLRAERDALQALRGPCRAGLEEAEDREGGEAAGLQERLESLAACLEEEETAAEGLRDRLEKAERKLAAAVKERQDWKLQLSQTRQENCTLYVKVEELTRLRDGLEAQVEVAKQNIGSLYDARDALAAENERLKASLASLAVKAEALVLENADVTNRLEAERARAQQYHTRQYRLADLISRVRTSARLFNERVEDVDREMEACLGRVEPEAEARQESREVLLDLSCGRSAALQAVVTELDHLKGAAGRPK